MKNEAEIIKLMDLLYQDEAGEAQPDEAAFLAEHPELAQELAELQDVRQALQALPVAEAPPVPLFMPPTATPLVRPVGRLYWAAAAVALILLGFGLAQVQVRYQEGELSLAFGRPVQDNNSVPAPLPQRALTSIDTQAIQDLVRSELTQHYTQLEQTMAQAQQTLRKDNDTQRLKMVQQLQAELLALNKQQQDELLALVSSNQTENLGKMVLAMQNAHSQQQEKLKWVLQQGFIDWNLKRESDLERIKDEFNRVYAQVHQQKLEQDRFNRAIIQQTNN